VRYDDEVREQMRAGVHRWLDEQGGWTDSEDCVEANAGAIPPLTLKTEDGRFVLMERVGLDPGGCPLYREVWENPK
jgi:hypothetical protein